MRREIPQKVDAPFNCVGRSRSESTFQVGATLFRRTRSASVLSITLTATALGIVLPQKSVSAHPILSPSLLGTLTALPQSMMGNATASPAVRVQPTASGAANIAPLQTAASWPVEAAPVSPETAFSTTPNTLSMLDNGTTPSTGFGTTPLQGQPLQPADMAAAMVPNAPVAQESHPSTPVKLEQKVIPNPGGILLRESGALVHTVEKGENLTEIADKYRVSPDSIAKTNRIDNPNEIEINEDLVIPPTTLSAATSGVIAAALIQQTQLRTMSATPALIGDGSKVSSARSIIQQNSVQSSTVPSGAVALVPSGVGNTNNKVATPTPPLIARRSLFPQIPPLDLPPLNSAEQFLPSMQRNAFQRFVWPAQGIFTSGYGWRWGRMHRGIDIAAPIGTPIIAAASGVVITAGWNDGGFGNFVEIRHPDGSLTRYAHNNSIETRVGATVNQGEVIARMGTTGRSTGPHLHFEIRPSGQGSVDPMFFLARR